LFTVEVLEIELGASIVASKHLAVVQNDGVYLV